ncbi:reverse transcriptase domain-containing protein, partial [Enterobacter ludwigii]|uniref:reverse transcriptase domain-containing protein n=1 Tax=Enterobacter ludwigii TaxID=299767 RepID=UPI003F713BB1
TPSRPRFGKAVYRQLTGYIAWPVLLSLLWQFLHYSVEEGGHFHTPRNGIPRASSLSLLLAAFHLHEVDTALANFPRVRYARYMDDFILITPTRHSLRRAIKTLKQLMHDYGFVLHPDKTQLGRTRKGFDWMGLWFTDKGITAFAPRVTEKHRLKCRQLYEQIRNLTPESQAQRMAAYRRRWVNALLPQDITHDIPDYDSEYVTVKLKGMLVLSSTPI